MAWTRHVPFLLLALALVAGCGSEPQKPVTAAPQPVENWQAQPLKTPPNSARPVQEGSLPLTYLVESPCIVRVADQTTGETVMSIPVLARTIVSVNPRVGVQIGGATMKAGPLPADHRYAIYLESNSKENYIERGTYRPGQPQEPGQQPAQPPPQPSP